jgi:hypothetical protein
MRYFRHAALFNAYFLFTLAVLALLASGDLHAAFTGRLRDGKPSPRYCGIKFLVSAVSMTLLAAVAYYLTCAREPVEIFSQPLLEDADFFFGMTWLGVLLVAAAACVLRGRWRAWGVPALLIILTSADALASASVSHPLLYNMRPADVAAWREIDRQHSSALDLTPRGLARDLRAPAWTQPADNILTDKNLPLKIPVLFSYIGLKNRFLDQSGPYGQLNVIAVGNERIWFSRSSCQVALSDATYAAYVKRAQFLGLPPLLLHSREALLHMSLAGEAGPDDRNDCAGIAKALPLEKAPVEVQVYKPEELAFSVTCPAEGWLLVTDRWSQGWTATVNGQPAEIWGGNFIYRALRVPAGKSEIRFSYHVFGWPWLLLLSWGTVAAVASGTIFQKVWGRSNRLPNPHVSPTG